MAKKKVAKKATRKVAKKAGVKRLPIEKMRNIRKDPVRLDEK